MFIKRDIYKYEFYLCNILKNGCKLQVNSVCNFFLLSQIVVNVDKNDKKNIPCALTCTLRLLCYGTEHFLHGFSGEKWYLGYISF